MDVTNKTKLPVKVKLPGGKILRLGPGNTGQITPKAAAHPPVQKLVEEGVLEISDGDGGSSKNEQNSGGGTKTSGGFSGGGNIRRTGNR